MRILICLLFVQLFTVQTFAHEGGHGTPTKQWHFINDTKTIQADFIQKDGDKVYLADKNHNILTYNYADFIAKDQQYILETSDWITYQNTLLETQNSSSVDYTQLYLILGLGLLVFAGFSYTSKTKNSRIAFSGFGVILLIMGCKNSTSTSSSKMAANSIPFLETIFGRFDKVNTRHDDTYFYIESNGIPDHEMMTGISNWQQQVPINHDYSGNNAWAIPLQPELAEHPLSTKDNFMKGAIAIAVNGIPIFNPLNNRGEDANAIGELDQWGGHCGRADDYHYHLPPTHLQAQVGADKPIAYALDGFPVYGETTEALDENLGRFTSDSTYQYHFVKTYPYFIAAMRGTVKINPQTQAPENEIMPQAKTRGVRPDLRPLRGAEIVDFSNPSPNQYSLTYTVDSLSHKINYGWDAANTYTFEFVNPDGTSETATYTRK